MVYLKNENLRPKPLYPTYPPYHKGNYLEEYFFNWWQTNKVDTDRNYIDVFWTNIYCNAANGIRSQVNIQNELDTLDGAKKYFTINQHDDGPLETLPMNTLIFSAGGNQTKGNIIPIPLICSRLTNSFINESKTILCSFVGSLTHPIRNQLAHVWSNDSSFIFATQNWTQNIPEKNLTIFKTLTAKSKFTLCPRGYGKSSFRLYEAMQLGSVPVYVSDSHYLPWTDDLDWSEFCVIVNPNEINNLKNILMNYSDDKINKMVNRAQKLYENYFSLDGMCLQIAKRIL